MTKTKLAIFIFISITLFVGFSTLIFHSNIPNISSRKKTEKFRLNEIKKEIEAGLSQIEKSCHTILETTEFEIFFRAAQKSKKMGRISIKPDFLPKYIQGFSLFDSKSRQFYPIRESSRPHPPGFGLTDNNAMSLYLPFIRNGQIFGYAHFFIQQEKLIEEIKIEGIEGYMHPSGHILWRRKAELEDKKKNDQSDQTILSFLINQSTQEGSLYLPKEGKSILYITLFPQKQFLAYIFKDNPFSLPIFSIALLCFFLLNSSILFFLASRHSDPSLPQTPESPPTMRLNPDIEQELAEINQVSAPTQTDIELNGEDNDLLDYTPPTLSPVKVSESIKETNTDQQLFESSAVDQQIEVEDEIELPSAEEVKEVIVNTEKEDNKETTEFTETIVQGTAEAEEQIFVAHESVEEQHEEMQTEGTKQEIEDPYLLLSKNLIGTEEDWPGREKILKALAERFPHYHFDRIIILSKEQEHFRTTDFLGFSKETTDRFIIPQDEALINLYLKERKIVYIHSGAGDSSFLKKRLAKVDRIRSEKFLFIPVHAKQDLYAIICLAGIDFKTL